MYRDTLTILREIIKLLSKEKELSIRQISKGVKTNWESASRGLKFLKEIGIVKERKGDETKRGDRLFSLVKNSS
jgi:predicted transcriptional regulator